jgi:2-amino-4-hydroxy-6-hydroxymethyldihydropteridine diphosphokinase/dihydropteroate synthase
MSVYLGLGSNLGDRRDHLRRALQQLREHGVVLRRIAPVVESPALLPQGAPSEWNRPYLNLAVECELAASPEQLRGWIQRIENQMGRDNRSRWSPRPIDIDILLWGQERIATSKLTIPHPELTRRSFVLTPLLALEPRLTVPGWGERTLLDYSRALNHSIPLWMGVVNITPDSFSDGGQFTSWDRIAPHVHRAVEAGAQLIDIGAESTRPGATPLNAAQEWTRLEPVLVRLLERYRHDPLRPWLSVDTYHPEVARKALDLGVDVINDVSGLTSPAMCELAQSSAAQWVAMHHLGIPASKAHTLPADCDPVATVEHWLLQRLEDWDKAGLNLGRIIFDPGIGFGKDALQSLQLLRHIGRLRQHGLRVLVGHSRKSFMQHFAAADNAARDLTTVGASLNLCAQGVDILRVHEIPLHIDAYRGWAHIVAAD